MSRPPISYNDGVTKHLKPRRYDSDPFSSTISGCESHPSQSPPDNINPPSVTRPVSHSHLPLPLHPSIDTGRTISRGSPHPSPRTPPPQMTPPSSWLQEAQVEAIV